MSGRIPPKRIERTLRLDPSENERFLTLLREQGVEALVLGFVKSSDLYLRGRIDGPNRTGARPCGYLFLSEESFDLCHEAVAHINVPPSVRPTTVTYRKWHKVLPFAATEWESLSEDDRQVTMRAIELVPAQNYDRAVQFARSAKKTFGLEFNIKIDRRT
jgi:hypothetical protein